MDNLKYIFPQVLLGIYLIKAFLNSNSIAEFEWGLQTENGCGIAI